MTQQAVSVLTMLDWHRLETLSQALAELGRPYAETARELHERTQTAAIVSPARIGPNVVTMNSRVRAKNIQTGRVESFRLVYPFDVGTADDAVSVLTPLGRALLGARVGQVIEWRSRYGVRPLHIEAVLYQPEAAGDLDL